MAFEYARPRTLAEASNLLAAPGATALAGGTDLMVAIRHRKTRPALVVDLKRVEDLEGGITEGDGTIRIGSLASMTQIAYDEGVRRHFPALVESASVVGSVQIRNRATLAGNLCNASPAADTAPALLAFAATVEIVGIGGTRTVPVSAFFIGPGANVLEAGDVVTAIVLPVPDGPTGSAFARVTRRRGVDLATINLACVVDDAGRVRFGFGAVGPTPLLAQAELTDLESDAGWEQVLGVATPIDDVRAGADYRKAMLEIHSRRALEEARARCGSR
jgi:CO/xanthine dehydrogenase FAD-binding subunit